MLGGSSQFDRVGAAWSRRLKTIPDGVRASPGRRQYIILESLVLWQVFPRNAGENEQNAIERGKIIDLQRPPCRRSQMTEWLQSFDS